MLPALSGGGTPALVVAAAWLSSWGRKVPEHTGLAALLHVGYLFPDQGLNPRPLNCKLNS